MPQAWDSHDKYEKAVILIWKHAYVYTHTLKGWNTYRQIFQLQLTDCIVRLDVFWDQRELEIGIAKDDIFLLPVRPILGTFNLSRCTWQSGRGQQWGYWVEEDKRADLSPCWGKPLTDPFSMTRFSITTPRLLCSHTISQKLPHVFGRGPWKRAKRRRLYS